MSSKTSIWLAFFLNLSYAIVEFIAGGIFGSSAVLADSVHDLGDAIAIGISAFLETLTWWLKKGKSYTEDQVVRFYLDVIEMTSTKSLEI